MTINIFIKKNLDWILENHVRFCLDSIFSVYDFISFNKYNVIEINCQNHVSKIIPMSKTTISRGPNTSIYISPQLILFVWDFRRERRNYTDHASISLE